MYPMYGHMDSYPHQRPYAPYNQNLDPVAYQMKPDLSKSPSPYEYHPYGFNNYYHPHPHPMEFHNCCNHNYFPNCYTFRPPYPHFPPPPPQPFHYHGNYAPHPHYPMELQPRYDYDKNTPQDHHCCGCTQHSCISKENQIVKMEEPDPDSEKKTSDSSRNYPYPVVWIPPGCLKKEDEKGKSVEVHSKGKEGTENSKSFDEGIRLLNGWLPLDMNKLESLMQDGDVKKVQEQKNDEDRRFPFSIFRVPSNPKELETNGPKENKLPSNFSITPMNAMDTEDSDSVQNIPKKMEKRNDKAPEEKSRNIPVEFRTDDGERKIAKNSEKGVSSSSSPRKSSKLPPVCLRVDPLPGKKRSSRSPSPTNKGKLENSTSENPKIQVSPNVKENSQETKHSSKPVEKSKENELQNGKCGSEESIEGKNVMFGQSGEEKSEVGEGKVESEKKENEAAKKILCDEEAAVIIQSVYRGYEVRKWEPLIKLKQIAKVKDQTAEIKRSIEALDASSTDDRQRLVIGETIMSLLLKLDTIQGLHPSIRDIRKSVARELVSLQEKLDALIPKKPIEDLSTTSAAPTATNEAAENVEPPLVHKEANNEEQIGNGGPPEAVEDINGKSENVLEDEAMQAEKENDEIVLKNAEGEEANNNGNEPAVVEDLSGKAEDSPVLEDEIVLPLEKEEPKLEILVVGEEYDEKALKEIKAEFDLQLEEAQQKEINREVKESSVSDDETTKADEVVKIEEPKFEIPIIGEGSDEKVLEETKAESCVQLEEAQQKGISGKVDESSVLVDEAMKADEVAITEEPKFEIPVMGEENDEKVLEETKAEADVQLEEAQQKEFDHIEDKISGKTEEVEVQADAEELMENQVKKEANDEYLGPKDDILVEEKNEVVADNIIEQPNSHAEVFVRQEIDEKLREENEKLKEMVEKLVEAGKEQLSAISNLSGKVKDLERKLVKKKKLKMRKCARKSRTFDEHMVLNE